MSSVASEGGIVAAFDKDASLSKAIRGLISRENLTRRFSLIVQTKGQT